MGWGCPPPQGPPRSHWLGTVLRSRCDPAARCPPPGCHCPLTWSISGAPSEMSCPGHSPVLALSGPTWGSSGPRQGSAGLGAAGRGRLSSPELPRPGWASPTPQYLPPLQEQTRWSQPKHIYCHHGATSAGSGIRTRYGVQGHGHVRLALESAGSSRQQPAAPRLGGHIRHAQRLQGRPSTGTRIPQQHGTGRGSGGAPTAPQCPAAGGPHTYRVPVPVAGCPVPAQTVPSVPWGAGAAPAPTVPCPPNRPRYSPRRGAGRAGGPSRASAYRGRARRCRRCRSGGARRAAPRLCLPSSGGARPPAGTRARRGGRGRAAPAPASGQRAWCRRDRSAPGPPPPPLL